MIAVSSKTRTKPICCVQRDAATKPLVVRLDGNQVEEGRAILAAANNPLVTLADTMDAGADKAAELANA